MHQVLAARNAQKPWRVGAQSTSVVSGAVHAASAMTKADTPFDSRKVFFSAKDTLATLGSARKVHASGTLIDAVAAGAAAGAAAAEAAAAAACFSIQSARSQKGTVLAIIAGWPTREIEATEVGAWNAAAATKS